MLLYFEILETLALFTGLVAFKAIRPEYLRWILLVLSITILNEAVLVAYARSHKLNRNIYYNLYSIIDMAVWSMIFVRIHAREKYFRGILTILSCCFAYCLIDIFWFSKLIYLHTQSHRLYDILIVCLTCLYFYRLLQKEFHLLKTDPIFWICMACFIYHSLLFIDFTFLGDAKYLYFKNSQQVRQALQSVYNSAYYLLLCITFIICMANRKAKMH